MIPSLSLFLYLFLSHPLLFSLSLSYSLPLFPTFQSKKTLKELDSGPKVEKDDAVGMSNVLDRSTREKEKETSLLDMDEEDDEISVPHSTTYGDRVGAGLVRTGSRTPVGTLPSNAVTGLQQKGTVGATESSPLSDEDRVGLISKPLVPTRLTVKKASTRAQQEAKRKADLAVRSKR